MFLEILFTLCLNAPQTSANESDINVKIQSIHSLPLLFDLELSRFHLALSQRSGEFYLRRKRHVESRVEHKKLSIEICATLWKWVLVSCQILGKRDESHWYLYLSCFRQVLFLYQEMKKRERKVCFHPFSTENARENVRLTPVSLSFVLRTLLDGFPEALNLCHTF